MNPEPVFVILLLILAAAALFLFYKSGDVKRKYRAGALKGLNRTADAITPLLAESDMKHLPEPVQKYLTCAGVIGKEKVLNVRITFGGAMKPDPEKAWARAKVVQYSFFDSKPTRLFYMKLNMFGLPFVGLHSYTEEGAGMLIKALGLVKVVDVRGPEMRISDTTTMFNDMCLMAPATLIDKNIQWESIDALTVKATHEIYGTKISALLYFNEKGELINFISDDRYMSSDEKSSRKGRWSTPVKDYKDYNGIRIASEAEAIWLFPEGDYCYGRFTLKDIEYNCETFK